MENIEVDLNNLNQVDDKFILKFIEKQQGLIKVTSVSYYRTYEGDDEEVKRLAKEWFDTYGHMSHAYRDGAKIPYENLVKVEIVKK